MLAIGSTIVDELIFVVTETILMFGAGLEGLTLRTWLPDRHAPEQARETIGAMTDCLGSSSRSFTSPRGVIETFDAQGS
jgi:hypothetical protein